jgi:glutamate synthase (NADPH/NADH) large chain
MTGGRVVILGDTGRNFAAGMSGGIAYVYDASGRFSRQCNREMVDLDPLAAADVALVQDLIGKHYEHTGSSVARFILDDWDNQVSRFIKVFPQEYKRVLAAAPGHATAAPSGHASAASHASAAPSGHASATGHASAPLGSNGQQDYQKQNVK